MKNNIETIEYLKEEVERGEASMFAMEKVLAVLKSHNDTLLKKFLVIYTNYYNGDIDSVPEDLLGEVYKAVGDAPEYVEPKSSVEKLMDSLGSEEI